MSYTTVEREDIRSFAAGGSCPKSRAIDHHHSMIARIRENGGKMPYGDAHFEFMREVDCDIPDLGLRARYRAAVLALTPAQCETPND